MGRLLAAGVLVRVDLETVELTREAALAVRGDRPLGDVAVTDPMPPPRHRDPADVDATAAGEILEVTRRAEAVLTAWSAHPPAVLRSGGLGVRDMRRVARDLGVTEQDAALLVEVLAGAGLVAVSEGNDPAWTPTSAVDRWLAAGPDVRWVTLARGWLDTPRAPSLVGARDVGDKLIGPLSDEARRPWAPALRRRVLDRLCEFADGDGPPSADDLVASLAWRAPRKGGRQRDEMARTVLREATTLGLVAHDTVTSATRELLVVARSPGDDPDGAAAAALRRALPEPIDHVLLQADLTAVAPGRLEPELAAALDRVADVESAGSATVYRISEGSVRRALDLGQTAADLHELFRTRSATPVPQGLTYLVDDVARRHGRLRGGAAASFLRSEDEALIAEVMVHPEAERLELRRIAPTVLVSTQPLVEVLEALRAAGLSPVAEDDVGGVLDLRPKGRRTAARRPERAVGTTPTLSDDQITALVAQLRAGDRAASAARGRGSDGEPDALGDDLGHRRGPRRGGALRAQRVDRLRRRPRHRVPARRAPPARRRRGARGHRGHRRRRDQRRRDRRLAAVLRPAPHHLGQRPRRPLGAPAVAANGYLAASTRAKSPLIFAGAACRTRGTFGTRDGPMIMRNVPVAREPEPERDRRPAARPFDLPRTPSASLPPRALVTRSGDRSGEVVATAPTRRAAGPGGIRPGRRPPRPASRARRAR